MTHVRADLFEEGYLTIDPETGKTKPTQKGFELLLYSNLSEESIEIFEEDVIEFFLSRAIEDACKKGKGSRSQIEEVFEPIFNLIIEKVVEGSKWEASQVTNFDWEEN